MRERTREAELRSLQRSSMYRIFGHLDIDERLPRELILESHRYPSVGRRHLAGLLWVPAFFVSLATVVWAGGNALDAVGVLGLLFAGFWRLARSGNH